MVEAEALISDWIVGAIFGVASNDVVLGRQLGIGAERGLEIRIVGEILDRVEGNGSPLRVAIFDEMLRSEEASVIDTIQIRRHFALEGIDEVAVGSDVLQTIKSNSAPFEPARLNVMGRARIVHSRKERWPGEFGQWESERAALN